MFHTKLVPVNVGQQLSGLIQLQGNSFGGVGYRTQFTNILNTELISNTGPGLLFHTTVTLEAYNTTAKSDYPTGSTVSSGTNLAAELGGMPFAVAWSIVNDAADGLSTTINVDGASGAVIETHY